MFELIHKESKWKSSKNKEWILSSTQVQLFPGDHLQDRYDGATFVKPTKRGRLKVKKDSENIPTANDLVFLKKSPDYCHANPSIGSLGRLCRLANDNKSF